MDIKVSQIAAPMLYPPATMYDTTQMSALREGHKSLRCGCPRKTNTESDNMIAKSAMIAPTQSLKELNNSIAPSVALFTIQRRLREKEIKTYYQRRKLRLSGQHCAKRLA